VLVVQVGGFACVWRRVVALPATVQRQRERDQRRDAVAAEDALGEAVAAKARACLVGLIDHERRLQAIAAAQVAEVEARARAKDSQARDTTAALDAACELVRALRGVLDGLAGLRAASRVPVLGPDGQTDPRRDSRRTLPSAAPAVRVGTLLPPGRAQVGSSP
jgi:hypothetical protein